MTTDRRAEIQGLRAIAVASVLLFHIWPGLLPGGYVGVDVFFVISGYLITGLLVREAEATGRISLPAFYARRVRRLLPAATFVLLAVTLCLPLLPRALWEDTAYEIAASALYVENWRLAWLVVDYLGAENEPSPVQHYWSLSIEEQFYIVWPLIVIAVLVVARSKEVRGTLVATLLAIFAASLLASVVLTRKDAATAYFVTHARIWELALGGLLALVKLPSLPQATREVMRLTGLAAIVVACVMFSRETRFPGAAALLPTLGCVLVIAAGRSEARWSSYRALAVRPAQYLGDISYSVYLWHWPLIVFASLHLSDGGLSAATGALVLAATLLLSAASKRYIEDPFRYATPGSAPLRSIAAGATSVASVVAVAAGVLLVSQGSAPEAAATRLSDKYPGAAALLEGAFVPEVDQLVPRLARLRRDISDAYRSNCHLNAHRTELGPCTFGPRDARFHVLLAGDSHAANWIPALQVLASTRGWRVETHTKSSCRLLVARVLEKDVPYESCYEWGQQLIRHIAETKPDLVIVAQKRGAVLASGETPLEDVIAETWRRILDLGVRVVAIADTPQLPMDPAKCVQRDRACAVDRGSVMGEDPMRGASVMEPRVPLIDMTDALCTETICPMVIGNVVVWRDRHHLTATYARSLANALGDRLMRVMTN